MSAIDETLVAANTAFEGWRRTDVAERAALLGRIADYYETHRDDLAEGIARDMGKPVSQGRGEIGVCAAIFRYYDDNAAELLAPDTIDIGGGQEASVELHPTGVILGVMPWNFPHYQLARLIAPSLLLGNTVAFKHASICVESAKRIEQLVLDCGGPAGLVANTGFSHGEVAEAIAHPLIAGVSFTGGEAAGAEIGRMAGAAVKPVVLELGGNDPFIVFDVRDVDGIARLAARTRLANGGQTCTSPKRVIVQSDIFEAFVAAYGDELLAAVPGDPLSEETKLGPMSSEGAANELREHLRGAVADGLDVRGDLEGIAGEGRDLAPFMIVDPDRNNQIWSTELFGPIAMLTPADTVDDAIWIANDSPYGLGATVYTDSVEHARRFVAEVETGMVSVNGPRGSNPALPFGGVKRSGIGRELGPYGVREFANEKLVVLPTEFAGAES